MRAGPRSAFSDSGNPKCRAGWRELGILEDGHNPESGAWGSWTAEGCGHTWQTRVCWNCCPSEGWPGPGPASAPEAWRAWRRWHGEAGPPPTGQELPRSPGDLRSGTPCTADWRQVWWRDRCQGEMGAEKKALETLQTHRKGACPWRQPLAERRQAHGQASRSPHTHSPGAPPACLPQAALQGAHPHPEEGPGRALSTRRPRCCPQDGACQKQEMLQAAGRRGDV